MHTKKPFQPNQWAQAPYKCACLSSTISLDYLGHHKCSQLTNSKNSVVTVTYRAATIAIRAASTVYLSIHVPN